MQGVQRVCRGCFQLRCRIWRSLHLVPLLLVRVEGDCCWIYVFEKEGAMMVDHVRECWEFCVCHPYVEATPGCQEPGVSICLETEAGEHDSYECREQMRGCLRWKN